MKALRASIIAVIAAAFAAEAGAFTMEPMTALLAPTGAGSVATFRIRNDGAERVAVRIKVLSRGLSASGEETNSPADELFSVYPARVVVEPGSQAAVKAQWRGPAALGSERSFRLVAEEVPLDSRTSGERASGIKVAFRYVASLYVGEARFAPALVATVEGAKGPLGDTGLIVEIRNEGTRHVIALDARVEVDGLQSSLTAQELGALSGANYLPGTGRRTFVPRPDAEAGRRYEAHVAFEGVY